MSIRRTGTRRVPHGGAPGVPKPKTTYQTVQQGFKELYNPQKETGSAIDVDIVFVPGLGAHPEDSWKSESGFNWATGIYDGVSKNSSESTGKKDGLARDFPRARILLYQYESAWIGDLKVKTFMRDIAKTMLEGLQANREKIRDRPIVFIGHSMGGLVIAKAITLAAETYRDIFPRVFECIAGCAFFGTPFGGAHVAAVASMLGDIGEKLGYTKSSALVKMMTPGDESLNELRGDFLRLALKLSPAVQLTCFYENHPTDFTQERYGTAMSKIAKAIVPKKDQDFVTRESATLPGIEEMGLAANHRDLIKFSDFKDSRYQLVREPLKRIIHGANLVVKNRLNSTRGIEPEVVNDVMELLNGGKVSNKRDMLALQFPPSIWIPKEPVYLDWLKESHDAESTTKQNRGQALYVRGPEGRGKTRATMAALQGVDQMIKSDEKENNGRGPLLSAYFFCEPSTDFSTAEDLLKSLVRQLIRQQATLAVYAKHFVKKKGDDSSKTSANLTVENLWQTLQDILTDEFIGRRVYFVINNLHVLPEDADSTKKLMRFLNAEMQELNSEDDKRVPTRWFLTSREVSYVEDALKVDHIRLIDLEHDKYCDQVQLELRKTAQEKVQELGNSKKYNKALTYYASSLIGKRASNSQWIKLSCMQLAELPDAESDLKIRHMLEGMPQELKALLDAAWSQIFHSNEKESDKIKELLRTLVLTFEEPTEDELVVLAGFPATAEGKAELQDLVRKCRPLLTVKRSGKTENTVGFMDRVVKEHLLEKDTSKKTLGMTSDEGKWQQGIIALRCLAHIKEVFDFPPEEKPAEEVHDEDEDPEAQPAEDEEEYEQSEADEQNTKSEKDDSDDDTDWDDDESTYGQYDEDDEAEAVRSLAEKVLPYPVKHWLHHASKATLEIAEDLSKDDFWHTESLIRYRWLIVYMSMTKVLDGFESKDLTALHIAAAVGFKQLVSALIENGHEDEINKRDTLFNTPLHFAAYIGRPNTVDELIKRGANIDDCIEIGEQTPLHMAAFAGHVKVMERLIKMNANANAIASDVGPVMNAAISSGNPDAVRLLVENHVSLAVEDDNIDSPLALAGLHSDLSMFEYLTKTYADKLPAKEFDKAFIKAAVSGRVDVFNKLLTYSHSSECFQDALEAATEEENWEIVMILLQKHQDLNCDSLFLSAATTAEHQDKVLEAVWKYTNGNISTEKLNESLYEATDLEKESTVKLLIETFNVNPNATGEYYGTALTAAAYDGTLDIVKLLLDRGAAVDFPNEWALQAAASEGHYDVVKELLDRGADVNAFTTNENFPQGTALQVACESGKLEIVTLLLERGANPNLGAGEDTCPLIAAASKGEQEILKLLVKARADVNVFGGWDNSTVLINAVANLPIESLQVLVDAGADVNLADQEADTALIVAAREGDGDSVRFLLDNGADIFHTNQDNENALQSAITYGGDEECTAILVERISELMAALKKAMIEGNTAVSNVVRSVGAGNQGLSYDDEEPQPSQVQEEKQPMTRDTQPKPNDKIDGVSDEEDGKGTDENTPRTESFSNSAQKVETEATETEDSSFRPVRQLSNELEAALTAQVSLLHKYTSAPPRPEKVPEKQPVELPPTTIPELPSQGKYSHQGQVDESFGHYEFDQLTRMEYWPDKPSEKPAFVKQPTLQWASQAENVPSEPVLSPGQAPIRRKPAPNVSFGAAYAQNSSPAPPALANSQYQPPPPKLDQKPSFDQRPPYQNSASYPGAPAYQGAGYPSTNQQPQLPTHSVVGSRVSNEYSPALQQPSGAYHAPYDPSSYGRPSMDTPPQKTQPFPDLPYTAPGAWQSSPPLGGGQQQQQSYFGPGNGSPPQQQEWSGQDPRPDLKSHRASFLGMKNTLDKAKQFSTGIMNRRTSGF
ncbi:multiple ankyrin repeats single kh domain-containing protein [Colletotrichum incanum]|uniref:Multiple ankyrin repeats single kh domain-containing protein n=1 Tax=Colletotrichum incanum TaxID=1573173 RepID=A0A161WEP5_COLIC|nr:multiple ankyrin repeats single kh domain-containing protein [Colletotrichum incanum]